jgi:hypothetical protein
MTGDSNDAPDVGEPFLTRWSRRKLQQDVSGASGSDGNASSAVSQPQARSPVEPPDTTTPDLPALDTLDGLKSDYQAFMRPGIADATRRTALKKLFSDPHFNVMDGLDTYIDDYSIEDPIPDLMLRDLNQARSLMLFEEKKESEQPNEGIAGQAQAVPAVEKKNTGLQTTQDDASVPAEPAATGPAAGEASSTAKIE